MIGGKKEPGDLGDGTGFAALLALLPEVLRRAKDADCVCGNCENRRADMKVGDEAPCGMLVVGGDHVYFSASGPPWRECRLFVPTEEFKKRTAGRETLGDLLANVKQGAEEKKP